MPNHFDLDLCVCIVDQRAPCVCALPALHPAKRAPLLVLVLATAGPTEAKSSAGGGVGQEKSAVPFFGWVFFLTSLVGRAPHVRPMWALNTRGEPNEIDLTIRALTV